MEVLTPLGDSDPLAASSERHPARAGLTGSVRPSGVRRMLGGRTQLRNGPGRGMPDNHDIPATDDDHNAATCHDHHCRAHWTDVTATVYDRTTGRLTA